jgi:hypothetical protein
MTGFEEFLDVARKEEARLERLVAHVNASRGWARRSARKHVEAAGLTWSPEILDPEFQKNLRIFRRLVVDAEAVCHRAQKQPDKEPYEALSRRLGELKARITLPGDVPLTLKVFLGHRFDLEQLLVELGDANYLRIRAAELYVERPGTIVTWRQLFPEDKPLASEAGFQKPESIDRLRAMVGQLLGAKEAQDMPVRARRELKQRALYLLLAVSVPVLAGFGVMIPRDPKSSLLLPALAGAAGAALGMIRQLRDELARGSQVREFVVFFLAQLMIGATSGLVVLLLDSTSFLNLGGPNGIAAFSFCAGLFEAAFIRLLGRLMEPLGAGAAGPAPAAPRASAQG